MPLSPNARDSIAIQGHQGVYTSSACDHSEERREKMSTGVFSLHFSYRPQSLTASIFLLILINLECTAMTPFMVNGDFPRPDISKA